MEMDTQPRLQIRSLALLMESRFSLHPSLILAITGLFLGSCVSQNQTNDSLRLYALDCGRIEIDLEKFTQGNEYDGQKRIVVASAFLIRQPEGDLLWDAGLPDAFSEPEKLDTDVPDHMSVPTTMASQLEKLDLDPSDIEYFSVSHSHFDHLGNANLLADATFLVDKDERARMFRQ